MRQWYDKFPAITGIFFDQGPDGKFTTDAQLNYYFALYARMKVLYPAKKVMLNSAGVRDERVLRPVAGAGPACDIATLVEKEFESYDGAWWDGASSPWWLDATLYSQIVHIIHTCRTRDDMAIAIKLSSKRALPR